MTTSPTLAGCEEATYRDKGGDQYEEFLCGRISISHQLLKRVDIDVLVYLFMHLPRYALFPLASRVPLLIAHSTTHPS